MHQWPSRWGSTALQRFSSRRRQAETPSNTWIPALREAFKKVILKLWIKTVCRIEAPSTGTCQSVYWTEGMTRRIFRSQVTAWCQVTWQFSVVKLSRCPDSHALPWCLPWCHYSVLNSANIVIMLNKLSSSPCTALYIIIYHSHHNIKWKFLIVTRLQGRIYASTLSLCQHLISLCPFTS